MFQLGLGLDVMEAKRPRPLPELQQIKKVLSLVCGGASTAVLVENEKNERQVFTWGCNDAYVLGRKTLTDSDQVHPGLVPYFSSSRFNPPLDSTPPTSLPQVVQIAMGDSHMMALDSIGTVYTNGCYRDARGILGFKPHALNTKQLTPEPMLSLNGKKIISIGSGENASLALSESGVIYIWGDSRISQRTSSRCDTRLSGLQPSRVPSSQRFSRLFVGGFHYFLIAKNTGTLWAFGLNNFQQLGIGSDDQIASRPKPVQGLPTLQTNSIKMAACGQHHSLLLMEDGSVYSWGRGEYGQLGHGDRTNYPSPKLIEALSSAKNGKVKKGSTGSSILKDGDRIVHIAAGGHHGLAVSKMGHAYSWGFGDLAQLGVGTDVDQLLPTHLDNTNPKSHLKDMGVVLAAGGAQHSAFVVTSRQPSQPS